MCLSTNKASLEIEKSLLTDKNNSFTFIMEFKVFFLSPQ